MRTGYIKNSDGTYNTAGCRTIKMISEVLISPLNRKRDISILLDSGDIMRFVYTVKSLQIWHNDRLIGSTALPSGLITSKIIAERLEHLATNLELYEILGRPKPTRSI